jgi:predicted RNase H-like HicB family nuclease
LRYYIGVLFEDPFGGFAVTFPDVPGCTAIGSTLQRARQEASKSLSLHLANMARAGEPVPEPSSIEDLFAGSEYLVGFPVLVPAMSVV